MELQKIKAQTTWQEAVDSLNANNQAIQIEFDKVGAKNRGYYISLESLQTAHPMGTVGDIAYVGTTAPFAIYNWNGTSWIDTEETGGSEAIDLSGFLPNTGGVISGDLIVDGDLAVDMDVEVRGAMSVTDSIETATIVVRGKTSDDILLGDGSTISKEEVGSLKATETSDINEYEDIWQ